MTTTANNDARALITDADGTVWIGVNPRFFLLDHPNTHPRDAELIFGTGATIEPLSETADMLSVLVAAGVFTSKGKARKNWHGTIEIPVGTTSFTVGKKNKVDIVVHRPPADLPVWGDADE